MADENPNNQNPEGQAVQIPSTRTNIQIRTQETDIESLKQTGGSHPLPETVSVNSEVATPAPVVMPDTTQMNLPAQTPVVPTAQPQKSFTWIFWIIGLVALFLVGYYVIPLFFG